MSFDGQVALVTGGGSGMGQLACERMAKAGKKVAALDVNEEGLQKTAASSENVTTYVCDVTDLEAVKDSVGKIESDLGQIDRVMTAAAIMPSDLIMDMSPELTVKVMDVNFNGVVNTVHATLPQMIKRGQGQQIIFASLVGWMPVMHFGAYCASKFAVRSYADILYHENRHTGVDFFCVCPPMVNTPLLNQVQSNPKVMDEGKGPVEPGFILDEIEKGVAKGDFWITPGEAKWAIRAARWMPNLIWKNMHKIEGTA